jgi:hypothetical protein
MPAPPSCCPRAYQRAMPQGPAGIAFAQAHPGRTVGRQRPPERHSPAARPTTATEAETAVAAAELGAVAGGRGDLLAEVAGIGLGFYEGRPEEVRTRTEAELCLPAGADESLIPHWAGKGGRPRAESRVTPPFSEGGTSRPTTGASLTRRRHGKGCRKPGQYARAPGGSAIAERRPERTGAGKR